MKMEKRLSRGILNSLTTIRLEKRSRKSMKKRKNKRKCWNYSLIIIQEEKSIRRVKVDDKL